MNVHTPERQSHESQADYRARQRKSCEASLATVLVHDSRRQGVLERQKPMSREDKRRAAVAKSKPAAPGPKFAKPRKHKQHTHPIRDAHGAHTLVGRKFAFNGETIRRMWLAGLSAQRGY